MASVNDRPVPPLLPECLPELAEEIRLRLRALTAVDTGRSLQVIEGLIVNLDGLRILSRCGCGDDFCASFYTGDLAEADYGKQETLILAEDFIAIDVLDGAIRHVEVLYRPDVNAKLDALLLGRRQ